MKIIGRFEKKGTVTVIKAPNPTEDILGVPSVFLGGSIEMGKAKLWQDELTDYLRDEGVNCVVLNPRRDDWDSSWKQEFENKQFRGHVEWELDNQEKASVIVYYIDPKTKSPITLLEIGLFKDKNPLVYCPEGFYRKGNVDVVAHWYGLTVYEDESEFFKAVRDRLRAVE